MDVHPAPTARTSQPPTHTDTTQNNTMSLTYGGPGWRVVTRFKLTCYHVLLARSTTGCTHLRSGVGAENRESGRGEGGGGQGTRCECGLAYTQHTNGVTQCSALQPPVPAPHTATSYAVTHRQQLAPGTGRGQGSMAPWTCNRPHRTQHHGAHLRGPRMARGRPLQADLLPRALCTIHCWVHTQLESAGRQRGEPGEKGEGAARETASATHTDRHGRPQSSTPQSPLPAQHIATTHAVTHRS